MSANHLQVDVIGPDSSHQLSAVNLTAYIQSISQPKRFASSTKSTERKKQKSKYFYGYYVVDSTNSESGGQQQSSEAQNSQSDRIFEFRYASSKKEDLDVLLELALF